MAKETGQRDLRRTGTFQEYELKVCDLCSSLNLQTNTECVVCGWNGHFDRSYDVVRAALSLAVQQHGRLDLHNLTNIENYREEPINLRSRIRAWIDRLRKWVSTYSGSGRQAAAFPQGMDVLA